MELRRVMGLRWRLKVERWVAGGLPVLEGVYWGGGEVFVMNVKLGDGR